MRRQLLAALLLVPAAALASPDVSGRGPYAVGLTATTFTKNSETTGMPRPLDTLVWYPAARNTGTAEGDVLRDADVLRGRWPLVMFSHGSCGWNNQSPYFTAGLASWGFVVASPQHPGNTIGDFPTCGSPAALGDAFVNRPADITFVIDQLLAAAVRGSGSRFEKRLNPKRIGMSGHSYGGHTTLRVAAADDRVRGAVALAPAIVALTDLQISVPTMVIGAELDSLTPFETASRGAYAFLTGPRFLLELLNTGHCAFAAVCGAICGAGCEPGTLTLDQAHRLTLRYATPFFDRYVAGKRRFTRFLRAGTAPDGVQLEEAHLRR